MNIEEKQAEFIDQFVKQTSNRRGSALAPLIVEATSHPSFSPSLKFSPSRPLLSGFKKVLNYTKKDVEDVKFRKCVSREEIEVHDVSKEMDLILFKQNCQVERIIADRISKYGFGDVILEYLVKWRRLSIAEATW